MVKQNRYLVAPVIIRNLEVDVPGLMWSLKDVAFEAGAVLSIFSSGSVTT